MEDYLNTTLYGTVNNSEMLTNETSVNSAKIPKNDDSADLAEKVRMGHLIWRPILIILGTIGNI